MAFTENEEFIRARFTSYKPFLTSILARLELDKDPSLVINKASKRFDDMLPGMAYSDKPQHPMAESLFESAARLALYLATQPYQIDSHKFGAAMLAALAAEPPVDQQLSPKDRMQAFLKLIDSSQTSQLEKIENEFIFDVRKLDEGKGAWAMDVQSCAVCKLFNEHQASTLTPYICATDDVISDKYQQGLKRTGSIALGKACCDFKYHNGDSSNRLSEQYPEQIILRTEEKNIPPVVR